MYSCLLTPNFTGRCFHKICRSQCSEWWYHKNICSRYGVHPIVIKSHFYELVKFAYKVICYAQSTTVLDCFQAGIKPFSYTKYYDYTIPWLDFTYSISRINEDVNTLLSQDEKEVLVEYGVGNLSIELFENKLDNLFLAQ
jgi:hypothetical protein